MLQTVAGSLACFCGGVTTAVPLLTHFNQQGFFEAGAVRGALTQDSLIGGVVLCSLVGAVVEGFPQGEFDNMSMPLAVAATARLFFGF
jgi:hypothetical protein